MLSEFLAVIDRLILLRKGQTERRRERFEKVLQPAFEEMAILHGDYVRMFQRTKQQLPTDLGTSKRKLRKEIETAKATLVRLRVEFEPVRVKLRTLMEILSEEGLPKNEANFLEALLWYFPRGHFTIRNTGATSIIEVMDTYLQSLDIMEPEEAIHKLSLKLDEVIEHQKSAWSQLCVNYGALLTDTYS